MDTYLEKDYTEQTNIKTEPEESIFQKIFRGDKVIWAVFFILSIISIIEIFSATSTIVYKQQNQWFPILKHIFFLSLGIAIIVVIHNIQYKFFSVLIFLLGISIVLLLITPYFGHTVNGADRWISIFGFTIQASEFAKISLIGTISFLLSKQNKENEKIIFKWILSLIIIVCAIIAIDNLSTAMLLFVVSYILMFIGNVKIKRLIIIALSGIGIILFFALIISILPASLKESGILNRAQTWENRITHFEGKNKAKSETYYKITDENFQVSHSKIAIANGGLFGKFPGNSNERDFLPQAYSDFIYSIIIEEMGIVGGVFVMILYLIILFRAGMIAQKTTRLFPKYLIIGSALMLSIQAFINMAVAVNLIPVTGQPLPLISRGGTSTLITCAYFGIILSADRFGVIKKSSKSENKTNKNSEPKKNNKKGINIII